MPYKPKITTRGISTTTVTTDTIPKGSPMTNDELDSNFLNLRDQSFALVGDDSTGIDIRSGDTIKLTGAGGATVTAVGSTITITAGGGGGGSLGDLSVVGSTILAPSNGDLGLQTSGDGYVHVKDKLAVAKEIYFDDYGDAAVEPPGNGHRMSILDEEITINSGRASIDHFRIYSRAGTGSQEFILDVNSTGSTSDFGHLKIYGLSYPQTDGTAGQVITTDGAGTLTFTTIAGTGTISFSGNTISSTNSNDDIALDPAGTGNIQMRGHIDVLDNKITTSSSAGNINFDKNIVLQRSNSTAIVTDSTNALKLGAGGDGSNKPGIGIGYDHYNAANTNDISFNMVSTGRLRVVDQNSTQTQTTIGANGAASALTANPVGYLKIKINNTEYIIPYYNG